ncbi:MAG TPA: hypothetical protein VMP00_02625 [Burkholderiales bacterium]|nr:hypothetical protein [Burkholderiales bacterium]
MSSASASACTIESASSIALLNGPTSVFLGAAPFSGSATARRKNALYCGPLRSGRQNGAPMVVYSQEVFSLRDV